MSQKRVGRKKCEPQAIKLNEHRPELNVFWTRHGGLGAAKIGKARTGKLLIKEKDPAARARTRWVTERIAVRVP